MKDLLLILSAVVTITAVIPYIRDILRGTTKPNIASWVTWTILFVVATIAEIAAGEYRTAFFTVSITIETALVVILGLKYGYAKYTKFDAACQISALLGFVAWWLFDNPLAAVLLVVAIDLLASLPTVEHSWFNPKEETWVTFALSGLGGFLAVFALTAYNWTSLLYPIYIVLINLVITSVLLLRRQGLRASA